MISTKSIWIIEDDPGCSFVYEEILQPRYSIQFFSNLDSFNRAVQEPSKKNPDLIIADLKLPDGYFLFNFEGFKGSPRPPAPVIVISALDDIDALRTCFSHGAIDYITKPFGRSELIVKVEKALADAPKIQQLSRSEFELDFLSMTLKYKTDQSDPLTQKEMKVLSVFLNSPDLTVSRSKIVEAVWGNVQVVDKTLDVHFFNIRKKLDEIGLTIQFMNRDRFCLGPKA